MFVAIDGMRYDGFIWYSIYMSGALEELQTKHNIVVCPIATIGRVRIICPMDKTHNL